MADETQAQGQGGTEQAGAGDITAKYEAEIKRLADENRRLADEAKQNRTARDNAKQTRTALLGTLSELIGEPLDARMTADQLAERVKGALTDPAKLTGGNVMRKEDVDRLTQSFNEKLKATEDDKGKAVSALRQYVAASEISKAAAEAGADPRALDVLSRVMQDLVTVTYDESGPSISINPEAVTAAGIDAVEIDQKTGRANQISVKELVRRYVEKNAYFRAGSGGGSGARPNGGANGIAMTAENYSRMTDAQKAEFRKQQKRGASEF